MAQDVAYNLTGSSFNFNLHDAAQLVYPASYFIIGIAAYTLVVFVFYKFVAKRDIFNLDLNQYNKYENASSRKFFALILYVLQNLFIFPIFLFIWFGLFALILAFISKNNAPNMILLLSIGLVGAIRITTYVNEGLAEDLAKTMPFALLAVFLADLSYISINSSLQAVLNMATLWGHSLYYLGFLMILEFSLKVIETLAGPRGD